MTWVVKVDTAAPNLTLSDLDVTVDAGKPCSAIEQLQGVGQARRRTANLKIPKRFLQRLPSHQLLHDQIKRIP